MGIIEPCHSRYNAPIFVIPKKGGKICFVLDYQALNDASHGDQYCMKDVKECVVTSSVLSLPFFQLWI